MSLNKQESDRLRQLQGNTNPTPAEKQEMEALANQRQHDQAPNPPSAPARLSPSETARLTELQAKPLSQQTDAEADEVAALLHKRDAELEPSSHTGLSKQEANRLRELQEKRHPTSAESKEIEALINKRDN